MIKIFQKVRFQKFLWFLTKNFQSTSMTDDESSACQITGEINQEMARGRQFQIDQCLLNGFQDMAQENFNE